MLKPRPGAAGLSLPRRLLAHVGATIAVGTACVAGAADVAVGSPPSLREGLGITLFFVLALLAELRPMPIDTAGKRLVSLAFVFIVASIVLFGWQWGVLIGASAIVSAMLVDRVAAVKTAFNGAVYAIAATIASVPYAVARPIGEHDYLALAVSVFALGAAFVLVNVLLVCGAIGLSSGEPVRNVFRDHLRHSSTTFGIMVFVAVQAIILWRLSEPLVLLLSAPLFALSLYQRSAVDRRVAEAAAATDDLTGLKNRRAFDDEVQLLLAGSNGQPSRVTLCLIDVDRFKQVNDRNGHAAGDAVLVALSSAISQVAPESGYRLGGDEFAIVRPDAEDDAVSLVSRLQQVFAREQAGLVPELVSLSAGIASYPEHAEDLHSLKKRADIALYQSKDRGRCTSTLFVGGTDVPLLRSLRDDRASLDSPAGVEIAHRLVALVDALAEVGTATGSLLDSGTFSLALDRWRASDGNHSRAVAELVVALSRRFGIGGAELEQLETAALLHDVGKIAIPAEILNKQGPLTDDERRVVERHPEIGHTLLSGFDCGSVAAFVLSHHERWDGLGYPHGLAGAEIPFGSRLIHVADAFDALTSDRAYRSSVSIEAALEELRLESGRQFDPVVVEALREHLTRTAPVVDVLGAVAAWSS